MKKLATLLLLLLCISFVAAYYCPQQYPQQYPPSYPYQDPYQNYQQNYQNIHPVQYDQTNLPLYNIFDPNSQRNEPITKYGFDDLNAMAASSQFRQWNDMSKFCDTVQIIYGTTTQYCQPTLDAQFPRGGTARAYAQFIVLPPPIMPDPYVHILVDPVFPPWSPSLPPP